MPGHEPAHAAREPVPGQPPGAGAVVAHRPPLTVGRRREVAHVVEEGRDAEGRVVGVGAAEVRDLERVLELRHGLAVVRVGAAGPEGAAHGSEDRVEVHPVGLATGAHFFFVSPDPERRRGTNQPARPASQANPTGALETQETTTMGLVLWYFAVCAGALLYLLDATACD